MLTEDVRRVLRGVIDPDNPDHGEAVVDFSERSDTSTRTIYRVLNGTAGDGTSPPSLLMHRADRLVTAAGRHLSECRVLLAEGRIIPYTECC